MTRPVLHEPTADALREVQAWAVRNREVVTLGLAWLRAALSAHVAGLRQSSPEQAFRGEGNGALSDPRADWLLRELAQAPAPERDGNGLEQARRAYDDARDRLRDAGTPAAIDRLSALFGLAPFDEDVLLLALAPRIEASFQALYGYAHDRSTLTCATLHLACALFAREPEARASARDRLGPGAPLRRCALVATDANGASALAPLEIDERIAGYLLGRDRPDARVLACLRPAMLGPCPGRHRASVDALAGRLATVARPAALLIAPRQAGPREAAARLAEHLGLGLVELEPRAFPGDPDGRRALFALVARESALAGFAVAIDVTPAPAPGAEDTSRLARELAEDALRGLDALLILLAEDRPALPAPIPAIRLAPLDATDRAALWREVLGPHSEVPDAAIAEVAEHFAMAPAEIGAAAAQPIGAERRALWDACREAAGRGLDTLAERIDPRFAWDDIVLPTAVAHDLKAMAVQVRRRALVYGAWGFGAKLARGRGVGALFAGPSGVGKTMAAEVIAGDLGLDLYRIDLSGVVSKYIGETEKNLRRVFDAAESAGAVLFFDEADALFGKRSEVKDSHDRYANIEVSYLLQRMEAYAGLVILATNLKSHLDDAFFRRLRFVIDFPFPDVAQRRLIWARAFPAGAPTDRLDLDALAQLEIAGGNIAVIALNAAFLAADEGRPIGMGHLARAARAEFRKIDKQFRPAWPEAR
jgi:hypothetical protein